MLVAVAAMASVSCQKQEIAAPETISTTLTLNAEVEQTKTYLGENNTVLWGENESVMLYLQDGAVEIVNEEEVPVPKFISSSSTSEFNGKSSAIFTFTFDDKAIVPASEYMLGGVYPASAAVSDNKNASKYKISLPATQNQNDSKYDPSAYIMVLKPSVVTEIPTEYTASFRRAVALNQITLSGVADNISSVEITVPETKYLAGRRYIDLTSGESGEIYYDKSNKVTVNGSFTDGTIDVWFTSWGVELAEGDELTIKLTSATKTYTRTIAARAEGIKFEEGYLNKLAVNMSSATVETLDNLSGAYLIVNTDLTRAAQAWPNGKNNLPEFELNVIDGVVYESEGIENCKMTIEQQLDGKYTIKDANGLYLYAASSSSNHLKGQEAASSWTIEQDGDKYILTSSAQTSHNIMRYNDQSKIFSCYSSGQKDITLYKYSDIKPDTTPRINLTKTTDQVEADGTSYEFTYTTNNITGDVTANVKEGATMTNVSASASDGTVTVTFGANTDSETKSATIVLSYEGAVSQEFVLTQNGKPAEGTPTTVTDKLVASLFVATNTTYANFSGVSVTSPAVYAGNSAKTSSGGIQLRSNNNTSGIVTTTSGGKAKTITVTWASGNTSGRTLDIYGKSTAYSAASDLYDSNKQGTKLGSIVEGTSTKLEITGDYEFIGLRSKSGAMYLTNIEITWETGSGSDSGETPEPEPGTGVSKTATIKFGSNDVKISAASVTGNDSENNTWTITTVGTTSYTSNNAYYQVGSSSKPATSITFTTTLPSSVSVSNVSAKFGGFSGTAGTVTLKVGETTVGTGTLNATNDVTVNSTSTADGNIVTVSVTGISKGVKCYYISVDYTE